ncbi:DUF2937 family protein [Maritimibacter sp. DP1N21-5]|uniref:DUF2937 family protein n=1 Tax=Maritimibacter sp. DP1N21-5 TaxID=2836867 RepID=UPI001C454694|nr:DUF2937 family protein [Maritimibacter sp. DP1N21-5]MBV7409146.1 DUF2937 family protein [Maritimibacter sp. DP1N21-5]
MFVRLLAFLGGLAGALALSQFPEFSQQYVQRLSGAVDELRAVTLFVDGAAAAAGRTREEALDELQSGNSALIADMGQGLAERVNRYERLRADYDVLRPADPLMRLARFYRIRDPELVQRTWDHYQPAVPVTLDGVITAGIGFIIGWLAIRAVFSVLLWPIRRFA